MSKVLIIAASNGQNLALAKKLQDMLGDELQTEVLDLVELELPLYSPLEEKKGIPNKASELKQKLLKANAMIFTAPEYNGSLPPTLNNFIAWISRVGKDWRECFNGKPAAIASHSGSGGVNVLSAMRIQLSYLGMNVLGRQIQTNSQKEFNPESAQIILKQLKGLL